MSSHPIEALWRENGLPEWFLGNGETNDKLYDLYEAIVRSCADIADRYDDCGAPFIAEKIRDMALVSRPSRGAL